MGTFLHNSTVLVVGAGIMGSGIAQVAAQAGHTVLLFDAQSGTAAAAKTALQSTFKKLVDKGKFSRIEAKTILSRITATDSLDAAATAGLVVEAIVESIDAKRQLFQQLEGIVSEHCVFATNTSSISVTAIANGLEYPQRLLGMHFFNPAALMKLVEVVSGLQTSRQVAESIFELARAWGKVPVYASSTPGFIVNRIARPFYAESLVLLEEQAATPAQLDACLRGAGFRMGSCELMDLIGHDTNFAVTRSVYEANFYDKRYAPSLIQQALVDGGLLGRKSGRGFYDYSDNAATRTSEFVPQQTPPDFNKLTIHGEGSTSKHIASTLQQHDCRFERQTDSDWNGLQIDDFRLRLTDGRCAAELGCHIAIFDLPLRHEPATTLAWSHAAGVSGKWLEDVPKWLTLFGFLPQRVEDTPGLVVARTIAMLINEAADVVHQGVCDSAAADAAMKLGVNYPAGPFEWLADWNTQAVVALLDRLDGYYRGERYRVSPWLRHRRWREKSNRISAE